LHTITIKTRISCW